MRNKIVRKETEALGHQHVKGRRLSGLIWIEHLLARCGACAQEKCEPRKEAVCHPSYNVYHEHPRTNRELH
jgi:hypothetical protein